jgi:ABC-type transport system substrate-binding protein
MVAWGLPVQDQTRLENESGVELFSSLMASIHHIGYNLREPPFDDVAARRAVAYAIPQQNIIDTVYGGTGSAIHNPMSPGFENWYWNDVEEYGLNLERARQILGEAGYQLDQEGRLHHPA